MTSTRSSRFPRPLAALALAFAAFTGTGAFAQMPLEEGRTWNAVKPAQPTDAPTGKVEVIEFFGYWCPHCNEFDPTMRDWARRNEGKVQMNYVPIAFAGSQSNLQKLYYALDAMGKEKELRPKVFSSIHSDLSLAPNADINALATWAEKNGLDKKKFIDTFNSFSVQSKVNRGNQLAQAYGVTGVPELGVGGKFLVSVDARSMGNADVFVDRVLTGK
jgi:thiol:disulfide interchange protein DsbA